MEVLHLLLLEEDYIMLMREYLPMNTQPHSHIFTFRAMYLVTKQTLQIIDG